MKQILAAVALAVVSMPALQAQQHPHYLHALSDLRYARALLNRPEYWTVAVDQKEAISRIDRAIGEIKRASIDDHKNLNDHPAPDPSWNRVGYLHKSIELLESVERDLRFEEDNYASLGWRAAAQQHVHQALELTRRALNDKRRDER